MADRPIFFSNGVKRSIRRIERKLSMGNRGYGFARKFGYGNRR
jgi:hypothetical protein